MLRFNLTKHTLPATVLLLALASCQQQDEVKETNIKTDDYEKFFAEVTEVKTKAASWIFSQGYSVTVNPRRYNDVRVYVPVHNRYMLVADYRHMTGTTEIFFEAHPDLQQILVEIGDRRYIVAPDTEVDANRTPNAPENIEVTDNPYSWIFAFETDYSDIKKKKYWKFEQFDFDFNDLVLKVGAVATDDSLRITLTPLACGESEPFFLHFKNGEDDRLLWPDNSDNLTDCEFHQWFGVRDYMTRVNTGAYYDANGDEVIYNYQGGWATQYALATNIRSCTLTLDSYWSVSSLSYEQVGYTGNIVSYSGLYLTIGDFRSGKDVLNNTEGDFIALRASCPAPHVLVFPNIGSKDSWRWPTETTTIFSPYPELLYYIQAPTNPAYYNWYEMDPASSEDVF